MKTLVSIIRKKKCFTFFLFISFFSFLILTSCVNNNNAKKNKVNKNTDTHVLKSAYIPILDCVPIIVAYEKGFYKEEGIKAEKPVLIRSWPAIMEAFTSRQIDLTHILLPQVIFLKYEQGIDLKSVGFNHNDVVAMLISKDLNGVCDLGGKMVGCPTWWAPHTGLFQDVIRKAGLIPVVGKTKDQLAPNEVGFIVVPPPDMVEGLKSGKIAGCTVSEPFGAAAQVLAGAKLVKMSGDVWAHHPCCQSVMMSDFIEEDRGRAQKITNAIYKATLWAHNHREELAQMLGKDGGGYFPMPIKVIRKALFDQDLATYGAEGTGAIMHADWNVKRVEFYPYPYPSAFEMNMDMMKRMKVSKSAQLSSKLINLSPKKIAYDIVDYKLADAAYQNIGGDKAFGLDSIGKERKEIYEVLLNKANTCPKK